MDYDENIRDIVIDKLRDFDLYVSTFGKFMVVKRDGCYLTRLTFRKDCVKIHDIRVYYASPSFLDDVVDLINAR